MKELKLTINLLPKGAWNNDFSKTLSKKDWDKLREVALKKANGKCEICGYETNDLDVHEEWEFNVNKKTQTLKDIIAICSKCHGVKHFKNSVRLGFGEEAQKHFIKVNNCSELQFVTHLNKSLIEYEENNAIYRWKISADLEKFGGKDVEIKQNNIPLIKNPYENVDWDSLSFNDAKELFEIIRNNSLICPPKVVSINVDNYQGIIHIKSLFTNKIDWYLDEKKIKTKYNVIGLFATNFNVEDLDCGQLKFKLIGIGGETVSKNFEIVPQEVL